MAPPKYIYQRRGGPLVTWNRLRPPGQTRAGDASALGSLGGTDVFGVPRRLPRGGAPEYISDGFSGLNGCGCKGNSEYTEEDVGPMGEYVGVGSDQGNALQLGVGTVAGVLAMVVARKKGVGWFNSIFLSLGASTIGGVIGKAIGDKL